MASGLLVRDDTVLLVRCRYAGESEALWTLPGGRQEPGELLAQTVRREFREETSLDVEPQDLAYLSESVDREMGLQVTNATFWVRERDLHVTPHSVDTKIVEARFIPVADAPALLRADVLRIPVAAALRDGITSRYFHFDGHDVEVPFFRRPAQPNHG